MIAPRPQCQPARRQPARAHPLAHIEPTGDEPRAGFYRVRLVKGGVFVAVRLWFGQPIDPDRPRLLDRSWRWQALANGRAVPVDRVWPRCVADPIDESEYRWLLCDRRWARRWAPHLPEADPLRPVDFRTLTFA